RPVRRTGCLARRLPPAQAHALRIRGEPLHYRLDYLRALRPLTTPLFPYTTLFRSYPTDSMRAAPRSAFPVWSLLDLNFELGRILVQKLAVVCQPEALLLRLHFKRMRQTQIAKLEMMAVSLAIGRNVYHRPAIACSLKHLNQP